ncbi:MAG TPA: hypothetical protein VN493_13525 [Thermoanaerobaculia bacterium]|nr:hypothetical protein [Thermoanaerobaculia bacterium]
MPLGARRLVLGFFLAWSVFAFLAELQEAMEVYDRRSVHRSDPVRWQFGIPQVDILQQCLAEARALIPPGSVVVFTSPGPEAAAFYRWRWAAYGLPESDVIQPDTPRAGEIAHYLLSHRVPIRIPRLELVKALTGCRLYRVQDGAEPR